MSLLQIIVNGEAQETEARTLAELCGALGLGEARVATALNGDFVPAGRRGDTALKSGDHVEIVSPRQGG
jgi:sulfur carrier protein